MKVRKKPVVVEAVRYEGEGNIDGGVPEWVWDAFQDGTLAATNGTDPLRVLTLEGPLTVAPGDWLIRGVKGELYPCKPDVFEQTYDVVEA